MHRLDTQQRSSSGQQASRIVVRAGSRLHFGLSSVGPHSDYCRGGLGVMIDAPRTEVVIEHRETFAAEGAYEDRVRQLVERWHQHTVLSGPLSETTMAPYYVDLPCKIAVQSAAAPHIGLGSGTQLGLAVALCLDKFFAAPAAAPLDLARRVGRGMRSTIGTFGFFSGGLLCDRQAKPGDRFTSLKHTVAIPAEWRIVVARVVDCFGLSGGIEQSAFSQILRSDEQTEGRMTELIDQIIVPSAQRADFETFCDGVFQYGRLSGELFAEVQGGIYNGTVVSSIVESMRGFGATGVGQSSWGPCVFAWCSEIAAAEDLMANLMGAWGHRLEVWHAGVMNGPAEVICRSNAETL